MLPATVLPHVLSGHGTHESLELAGIGGHDPVHVGVQNAGASNLDGLERKLEASIRQARDSCEHYRRVEAQREYGRSTRRLGQSAEERHPRGGEARSRLIHEEGDCATLTDG